MDKHTLDSMDEMELTLTDQVADDLIEGLNIEIEILQGEKKRLSDGRTWYKISVNPEKGKIILSALMTHFFIKPGQISNN